MVSIDAVIRVDLVQFDRPRNRERAALISSCELSFGRVEQRFDEVGLEGCVSARPDPDGNRHESQIFRPARYLEVISSRSASTQGIERWQLMTKTRCVYGMDEGTDVVMVCHIG